MPSRHGYDRTVLGAPDGICCKNAVYTVVNGARTVLGTTVQTTVRRSAQTVLRTVPRPQLQRSLFHPNGSQADTVELSMVDSYLGITDESLGE
jgi:hypothetical protein